MTLSAEWTGRVGDEWASEYRRTDRSFAALAPHLDAAILAAAPYTGRAVDIGCGAGATSVALATAGPGLAVTGIDLSPALIAVARDRAAGLTNLTFTVGDVTVARLANDQADLLCSRHGVMFFDEPVVGLAALRAATKPRGRLVFSCFRAARLNPWASEVAAAILGAPPSPPDGYVPGPFAFADPQFVAKTLRAAGWQPAEPIALDFAYRCGAGADPVADALDFFQHIGPAAPALRCAAPDQRSAILDRVRAVIERYATADAVDFPAAAWIWTAHNPGEPA